MYFIATKLNMKKSKHRIESNIIPQIKLGDNKKQQPLISTHKK